MSFLLFLLLLLINSSLVTDHSFSWWADIVYCILHQSFGIHGDRTLSVSLGTFYHINYLYRAIQNMEATEANSSLTASSPCAPPTWIIPQCNQPPPHVCSIHPICLYVANNYRIIFLCAPAQSLHCCSSV